MPNIDQYRFLLKEHNLNRVQCQYCKVILDIPKIQECQNDCNNTLFWETYDSANIQTYITVDNNKYLICIRADKYENKIQILKSQTSKSNTYVLETIYKSNNMALFSDLANAQTTAQELETIITFL